MKYDQDIQCIISPTFNRGGLFISNVDAARNIHTLKKNNIKAVVSIAKGTFLTHNQKHLPNYLYIPAHDSPSYNISAHFDQTFEFIDKYRRTSNVLVHCVAGVSRSVTIIIAYLIRKTGKTFEETLREIRNIRSVINPNDGFRLQLLTYQKRVLENQKFSKDVEDLKFFKSTLIEAFKTDSLELRTNLTKENFDQNLTKTTILTERSTINPTAVRLQEPQKIKFLDHNTMIMNIRQRFKLSQRKRAQSVMLSKR